jgi:hypothetical protein
MLQTIVDGEELLIMYLIVDLLGLKFARKET